MQDKNYASHTFFGGKTAKCDVMSESVSKDTS